MSQIESLKQDLQQRFSGKEFRLEHTVGDDVLSLDKQDILPVFRHLKESGGFDFLMDVCGVDYLNRENREKRFDVVYHLFSSRKAQRLRIKVQVAENETVDSVTSVWKGADWFEREVWDMFGIRFNAHPNLKRILLYDEFVGHHLRKDYPITKRQPLIRAGNAE